MTTPAMYATTATTTTVDDAPIALSTEQLELIETVESYVTSAIERRLRADYPNQRLLGVFVGLTGSVRVDTMVVDVIMEEAYPNIPTFTINNPQAAVHAHTDPDEAIHNIGILAARYASKQLYS